MKARFASLLVCLTLLATTAPAARSFPVEVHRSGTRTAAYHHRHHRKMHTTPVVSRVNLNKATESEIAALPSIDPPTAARIVAARPITDAKELVNRGVITEEQYDKIHLRISTADADEATSARHRTTHHNTGSSSY
jgi:hypothetical protein